jgi:hypothetical protein
VLSIVDQLAKLQASRELKSGIMSCVVDCKVMAAELLLRILPFSLLSQS